jgi:hypothetical protein
VQGVCALPLCRTLLWHRWRNTAKTPFRIFSLEHTDPNTQDTATRTRTHAQTIGTIRLPGA